LAALFSRCPPRGRGQGPLHGRDDRRQRQLLQAIREARHVPVAAFRHAGNASAGTLNQLDVAHLPFVHRTTIGRGNRTLIEGPGFEWKDDSLFLVYVYNKLDDGSKPRTPEEVPVPDPSRDYKLEFILPNLWENRIGDKVRVAAAFVPVDEEHAILYLRWYQSFMTIPPFSWLVDAAGLVMSRVIAHQDRRVVNTQLPRGDGTGSGELLFPGDKPIMEFRKRRIALRKKTDGSSKK
jgi:phenylpropionate dioxygenase-like ring-hydroxylating dioxygenase large terminal subunit